MQFLRLKSFQNELMSRSKLWIGQPYFCTFHRVATSLIGPLFDKNKLRALHVFVKARVTQSRFTDRDNTKESEKVVIALYLSYSLILL